MVLLLLLPQRIAHTEVSFKFVEFWSGSKKKASSCRFCGTRIQLGILTNGSSVLCGIRPASGANTSGVRGCRVVLEGAGVLGGASIFFGWCFDFFF